MSGWATRTSILMVDASEYSSRFQSQFRVSNSAGTDALCKDLGHSTRKYWTLRLNLCFVEKAKAYNVGKRRCGTDDDADWAQAGTHTTNMR